MKILKSLLYITIIAPLTFTAISCDEDTASSENDFEPSEAPDLPAFSKLEMKTDLFQQPTQFSIDKKKESTNPMFSSGGSILFNIPEKIAGEDAPFDLFPVFTISSSLVMAFETFHNANIHTINSYLEYFDAGEAEISGDEFVWSYETTDPETGQTFFINVMASITGNQVDWVIIASAEGVFEEQQIMEGSSKDHGQSGTWVITLDYPDERSFESTCSWIFENESLASMDIEIHHSTPQIYESVTGTYEQSENAGRLKEVLIESAELEDAIGQIAPEIDLSEGFNVAWDIETGEGSITFSHQRYCWDENQMPTGC